MHRIAWGMLLAAFGSHAAADVAAAPIARLKPVPFTDVRLEGGFWAARQETNRTVSIPHSLEMLKKAGNLKDLQLAASGARQGYEGPVFIDSDLYKAVEAAAYSLANHPDAKLDKALDEIIAQIAAAQQPDGYLNSWKQVNEPDKRWTNLRDQHELYCAGHLMEAAVAHFQATGKRTLLDVAVKFADYIDSVFGSAPGKRMGYCGHEEIELALFKLWKVTGEQRYFDLSRFFLESRGQGFFAREHNTPMDSYEGKYWQDNVPLRDHKKIAGHAVRAGYLLSAATDYAIESEDPGLMSMLDRVWHNTTGANMYITGGIGSSAKNEGFTRDYDLPNESAYQETCASVAMIMWNHRLGLMSGEAKYGDCLERALYNGFLAGVSLDGTKFFYVNPLASKGKHHRTDWYSCACCPPNVTRTLAQLGGYAYATSQDALWVHQYIQGHVKTKFNGVDLSLRVKTDYPWDGRVELSFDSDLADPFSLKLRIPEWCTSASATLNGKSISNHKVDGYLAIPGARKAGDTLVLDMEMPVQRIAANPLVEADRGRLAIQRGPVVYCVENADNTVPIHELSLTREAQLNPERHKDLLGDVIVITGMADAATSLSTPGKRSLYASFNGLKKVPLTAIPYYAWDNRTPGDMAVWIPTEPALPDFKTLESAARATSSFVNSNADPSGANDGIEPAWESDEDNALAHWWPHNGTTEWLQYEWPEAQMIGCSRIYWFDDTGRGQCRLPENWHLEFLNGETGTWTKFKAKSITQSNAKNCFEVEVEPARTTAVRLVAGLKDGFSAGVHEWQVSGSGK